MTGPSPKVLAVASGGGHWIQLMRLRDAFEGYEVAFVGLDEMYRAQVAPDRFYSIPEVSRMHKWTLPVAIIRLLGVMVRERPDVVVTTGSAPGMLALRMAKMFRARTIWIDSIANAEEMSLSGRAARKYADLWLTQWPHLSTENGPTYMGRVL